MKARILSVFRHLVTYAAGFGGWAVAHGIADQADASQLSADATKLAEGAAGILAVIVARLVMWLIGKYAPSLKAFIRQKGGAAMVALFFMAYATVALTSCKALEDFRFTGSAAYRLNNGSKAGIECVDGQCGVYGQIAQRDDDGNVRFAKVRIDHKSAK